MADQTSSSAPGAENINTIDSGIVMPPEPPRLSPRDPSRRGVFCIEGEWLLDIKQKGFPSEIGAGLKTFLNFFYDRGLIETNLEARDTKSSPYVAVLWIWTRRSILESCIKKLHAKVNEETPKLIIYCGDGNRDDFQTDFQLMEITDAPCFQNTFVVHKVGKDYELLPFLSGVIEKVCDAEYDKYPRGYSCISEFLGSLAADMPCESIKIVNKLRNQLRIEGYPMEHCYLKDDEEYKKKVEKFRLRINSPSVPKLKFRMDDLTNEIKSYDNKLDGKVLIISIEKFEANEKEKRKREVRMSARIDEENLVFLFHKVLEYPKPEVKRNLKAEDIEKAVKDFSSDENHGTFAILVILTHGNSTKLYGADSKPVWTRVLIDTFGDSRSLAKKPKFFIIDACRYYESGSNNDSLRMECNDSKDDLVQTSVAPFYQASGTANAEDNSPDRAGLLVAFSASLGSLSHRLSISGSRFICSLCWVFCTRAATEDVVSMIADVNYEMTHISNTQNAIAKQISSWSVQMTRKFYLTRTDVLGEPVAS